MAHDEDDNGFKDGRKTVELTPVNVSPEMISAALGRGVNVLRPVPRFRWVVPATSPIMNIIGAVPSVPKLQQLHLDVTGRMGDWKDVECVFDNGQGVSNVWDGK